LKALHGSGITALDNLAGEIDINSQTTFEKLNSQVQSHTSALEKVSFVSFGQLIVSASIAMFLIVLPVYSVLE
jgi:hypothetical protein